MASLNHFPPPPPPLPPLATHPQPTNYSPQAMRPPASNAAPQFHRVPSGDEGRDLDTMLSGWTIEKPFNSETWEKATPKPLRLPFQDLQDEISKFRRKNISLKDTLNTIKSQTARRMPNDLVEEQNEILWRTTPSIQWTIASIDVVKDTTYQSGWSRKPIQRLKRVDFVIKTEPRPLTDWAFETGRHSHMQRTTHDMPQAQHQTHPHPQVDNQRVAQSGPPPPLAPPFGAVPAALPPPPPFGPVGAAPPPPQNLGNDGKKPQQPHGPINPVNPGKPSKPGKPGNPEKPDKHPEPTIQIMNVIEEKKPKKKEKLKVVRLKKHTHRHGSHDSDDSEESYSDSQFSSRSVEGGDYSLVERSRSRGRKYVDYVSRSRSHSRSRSRSQSRTRYNSRDRGRGHVSKVYKGTIKSRRRPSIEPPPMGKYSVPNDPSPRSSGSAILPQNIFNISFDKNNGRGRESEQYHRDTRRTSHSISPTGYASPPLFRLDTCAGHDLVSRSRNTSIGSDTSGSFIENNSSIYSPAGSSVFSEPFQSRKHSHPHSHHRPRVPTPPRPDFDRFTPATHYHAEHHIHVRDRDTYHDTIQYPPPPVWYNRTGASSRRHSMQANHTFIPSRVPDPRDMRYTNPVHGFNTQHHRNQYNARDFMDVVPYAEHKKAKRVSPRGSLGLDRADVDTDEWANRQRYDTRGHQNGGYRYVC